MLKLGWNNHLRHYIQLLLQADTCKVLHYFILAMFNVQNHYGSTKNNNAFNTWCVSRSSSISSSDFISTGLNETESSPHFSFEENFVNNNYLISIFELSFNNSEESFLRLLNLLRYFCLTAITRSNFRKYPSSFIFSS
jgi:hypothetical protein